MNQTDAVQRYDYENTSPFSYVPDYTMVRRSDGDWVRWEDVERLLADRDAQVREAEERAFMAGRRLWHVNGEWGMGLELPSDERAFAAYLTRQPAAGAHTEEQKP